MQCMFVVVVAIIYSFHPHNYLYHHFCCWQEFSAMMSPAMRALWARAMSEHAKIQPNHARGDGDMKEVIVTKTDRRLSSSYDMYKLGSQLEAALAVLEESVLILN